MMATRTARLPRPLECRTCGRKGELHNGICPTCDEAGRLVRLGACPLCAIEGVTRAAHARGLCRRHHRQAVRQRVIEATGYVGNDANRDDYNSLVECLIASMLELAPDYTGYLQTGVGYRDYAVQAMHQYLKLARCGLRPPAYAYVIRRVNTALPLHRGIPLPRGVYETTPAQSAETTTALTSAASQYDGDPDA